jgi:hypothetical protein
MSWKFVKGKSTLKTIPELHADQLTIPQPDGTTAPIPACPNDHSAKTFGASGYVVTRACANSIGV